MSTVKRLWGVSNHTPDQTRVAIQKALDTRFAGKVKVGMFDYANLTTKGVANLPQKCAVWVVNTAHMFDHLLAAKIDLSKITVVLVDNVVYLQQYESIKPLDYVEIKSFRFRFKTLEQESIFDLMDAEVAPVSIERDRSPLIPKLLWAQPISVLHPIMTFIYSIPDTTKRTAIQMDIFNALIEGKSIKKFSWYKQESAKHFALSEWLDSEVGVAACKALSRALTEVKISDSDDEFHALSDKYGVSKFDINYAVIFIKRHKGSRQTPEMDIHDAYLIHENRLSLDLADADSEVEHLEMDE